MCLIPEVPFKLDKLMEYVGEVLDKKGNAVVCVAEGAGQVRGWRIRGACRGAGGLPGQGVAGMGCWGGWPQGLRCAGCMLQGRLRCALRCSECVWCWVSHGVQLAGRMDFAFPVSLLLAPLDREGPLATYSYSVDVTNLVIE